MKYLKYLVLLCGLCMIWSCGGDDDICESGEGTPRLRVSFKSASTGKILPLENIYVAVDYGSGKVDLGRQQNVESILVPLRVDDNPYTDIYVKLEEKGKESQVRISYTTKATYVSPGCGAKKSYENLNAELSAADPVKGTEVEQNQIENEDKTGIYLIF